MKITKTLSKIKLKTKTKILKNTRKKYLNNSKITLNCIHLFIYFELFKKNTNKNTKGKHKWITKKLINEY